LETIYVKICGITNLGDALDAVKYGADAVGFIFHKESPRYISSGDATTIIRKLPKHITKVGVFVDTSRREIETIARTSGLSAIQLHGDQHPEDCTGYDVAVIKAFRIGENFDVAQLGLFDVRAILLDTLRPGKPGGTGETFDWNIAIQAKQYGKLLLSGGLTPKNIEDAIRFVRPYGVDVCSGVEVFPGKKDCAKVREFIIKAKTTTFYDDESEQDF
jgi:phosphoribosylanthranilate isomerase